MTQGIEKRSRSTNCTYCHYESVRNVLHGNKFIIQNSERLSAELLVRNWNCVHIIYALSLDAQHSYRTEYTSSWCIVLCICTSLLPWVCCPCWATLSPVVATGNIHTSSLITKVYRGKIILLRFHPSSLRNSIMTSGVSPAVFGLVWFDRPTSSYLIEIWIAIILWTSVSITPLSDLLNCYRYQWLVAYYWRLASLF
jgi:hypothetical protein